MHNSADRPLDIIRLIKWGNRALYVLLFISCMVVMGYWHTIITYTFLGSVFALILPLLFWDEGEEDSEQEISCLDVSRV